MSIEQLLNSKYPFGPVSGRRAGRRGAWLAAAALAACAATSCGPRAPAERGGETVAIRVQKPDRVRRPATVAASGTVEGTETVELAFQVAGRAARVLVEEGQRVRRGELLAELDSADYRFGLEAAQAQAAAARANLDKARAGVRAEELEQARAAYARAEDEYQRYRQLHERRSMAPADFAKVEAAWRAARAQLEMAERGAREEDRRAADAAAGQAQAQVEASQKRVADTRLLSPIDGVVARRGIDPGETAAAGIPVFSIVALDPARVRVGIPEADVGEVRRGQHAVVVIPSLGNREFSGTVDVVGVAADPSSRTFSAKITVPNPRLLLKAGMIAEARVVVDRIREALVIPGEAIVRDPQGGTLVYVYYPDKRRVHGRRVEAGAVSGRSVEITAGLTAEDLVVVAGQHRVREGSAVEVAP
jgi:membrane fusion protein (multidrug efflux system)